MRLKNASLDQGVTAPSLDTEMWLPADGMFHACVHPAIVLPLPRSTSPLAEALHSNAHSTTNPSVWLESMAHAHKRMHSASFAAHRARHANVAQCAGACSLKAAAWWPSPPLRLRGRVFKLWSQAVSGLSIVSEVRSDFISCIQWHVWCHAVLVVTRYSPSAKLQSSRNWPASDGCA